MKKIIPYALAILAVTLIGTSSAKASPLYVGKVISVVQHVELKNRGEELPGAIPPPCDSSGLDVQEPELPNDSSNYSIDSDPDGIDYGHVTYVVAPDGPARKGISVEVK